MNTKIQNLEVYKPAPGTTGARREVDWSKMTNEKLKFALDLLSLHQSAFEIDCANEIQKRIERGTWVDFDQTTPPLHNVPVWLSKWLSRSLWRQKP